MSHIDAERFSEIIGAIYDCVVAPEKWQGILATVATEYGYDNIALSVHALDASAARLVITVGIEDDWLKVIPGYSQEIAELWGGPPALARMSLEEPLVASEAVPRATWLNNRYIQEVLRPRGYDDALIVPLVRDSRTTAGLSFARLSSRERLGEPDKAILRLLAPHLRRAVVISRLLEQEKATANTFTDIVEGIAPGVILVETGMGIVYANRAAQRLLEQGEIVEVRGDRLVLRSPVANAVVADAVAEAARSEQDIERRSIDIPVRKPDGLPAVVQVLPMQRRQIALGVVQRPAAAVFIANAADPPRLPADALALLYDLTPAEARVFEFIVAGKTPADIAQELRVALPTVRTHLSRVFEKTGCSRQADLISIAMNMARVI